MTSRSRRSVFDRPSVPTALALGAALLAAIPLVISRLDGDADLDPYFAALVVAALVIGALSQSSPRTRASVLIARLIVLAWWGVAVWAAFLLVWFQAACGCSRPDPASLPPPRVPAALATAFHLAATYGGGVLVALAAFGPRVPPEDTGEPA